MLFNVTVMTVGPVYYWQKEKCCTPTYLHIPEFRVKTTAPGIQYTLLFTFNKLLITHTWTLICCCYSPSTSLSISFLYIFLI